MKEWVGDLFLYYDQHQIAANFRELKVGMKHILPGDLEVHNKLR